jgi:hypothetical protein
MYDFQIFGYYAAAIGATFFPGIQGVGNRSAAAGVGEPAGARIFGRSGTGRRLGVFVGDCHAGFSLAYSLATAIFGGFTPAICTYLIHLTGN